MLLNSPGDQAWLTAARASRPFPRRVGSGLSRAAPGAGHRAVPMSGTVLAARAAPGGLGLQGSGAEQGLGVGTQEARLHPGPGQQGEQGRPGLSGRG